MNKYFSTHKVAQLCHVSRSSVIRWIHEGKLSAAVTAGGHHRISEKDLIKLLATLRMEIPKELRNGHGEQYKILIVDDEPAILQMLTQFFKEAFPKFDVSTTHEGFEAGLLAHRLKPDLILLDLMLPGMDGFEVCRLLRTEATLKHTKIIAMTGICDPDAEERIRSLGADDFLAKPLDLITLKKRVKLQTNGHVGKEVRDA